MNWDIQYGELENDKDFVNKCENLKVNLMEVQKVVDECLKARENYDKMPLNAQIELDLFLIYALNSLQWIQLRIQGIDPSKHPIKNELQRIKKTMLRWQEVKDKDKRPKVDKAAAKRFVKSGLFNHKNIVPQNKRIKFDD